METARHPRLFYHVRERCAYSGPTTASPSNGRRNSTQNSHPLPRSGRLKAIR